jgi:hypothetical protein
MDDHVMMEPTKRCQVIGIGWPAPGPGDDVMRLEAVSAGAPVSGASTVAMQDETAKPVRDDPGATTHGQRTAPGGPDHLEIGRTGNPIENLGVDGGRPADLGAVAVEEDRDQRNVGRS